MRDHIRIMGGKFIRVVWMQMLECFYRYNSSQNNRTLIEVGENMFCESITLIDNFITSARGRFHFSRHIRSISCIIFGASTCRIVVIYTQSQYHCYSLKVAIFSHRKMLLWRQADPKKSSLIARLMVPTWGPSGADRTQVGPMLAPWTLLSGIQHLNTLWW